jgi:DNA-directed RNA polymerase subunit beta'
VSDGAAVGIIAAQSIGEPGTQLTMRTFHTGGVAEVFGRVDITSGLPRVEELFEARVPKGAATIAEIDGKAELIRDGERRTLLITNSEMYRDEYTVPKGAKVVVKTGDKVEQGDILAAPKATRKKAADKKTTAKKTKKAAEKEKAVIAAEEGLIARTSGEVAVERGGRIAVIFEEEESRDYVIPAASHLHVHDGDLVHAGQPLTDGPLNPQDILGIQGPEAVQMYLVEEVQKVYRAQGVTINDKHIEVIVRQMLRRVRIDSPGDTALLPGELVDRFRYEATNAKVLAEGGEPATAQPVLLGVTKASLNTESFLAAASFQETTRVLTEAAINGAVDKLLGLKENVIIGKLIPARTEVHVAMPPVTILELPAALMAQIEAPDADDGESEAGGVNGGPAAELKALTDDGETAAGEEPVAATADEVKD